LSPKYSGVKNAPPGAMWFYLLNYKAQLIEIWLLLSKIKGMPLFIKEQISTLREEQVSVIRIHILLAQDNEAANTNKHESIFALRFTKPLKIINSCIITNYMIHIMNYQINNYIIKSGLSKALH
jgi:hypothetical protein